MEDFEDALNECGKATEEVAAVIGKRTVAEEQKTLVEKEVRSKLKTYMTSNEPSVRVVEVSAECGRCPRAVALRVKNLWSRFGHDPKNAAGNWLVARHGESLDEKRVFFFFLKGDDRKMSATRVEMTG